jgi:DNA-binding response OmpR family regulator
MSQVHILVVDDEPQIRRTLRATLVPHGYKVDLYFLMPFVPS